MAVPGLSNAVWEVYKLQELGLLQTGPDGPGLTIDPPEAEGDRVHDYRSWLPRIQEIADSVYSSLEAYISIHDRVFRVSLVGSLREIIPIPGIYRRAPYRDQVAALEAIAAQLGHDDAAANALVEESRGRPRASRALLKLCKYVYALRATVTELAAVCGRLAEASEARSKVTWRDFGEAVDFYEQKRSAYGVCGTELNHALQALRAASAG